MKSAKNSVRYQDGTIEYEEAHFDGLITERLGEMALTDTRRPDKEHVAGLADELAGGEVIYLFAFDRGIKRKVKVLQGSCISELGGFTPAFNEALLADIQFILHNQFQGGLRGQISFFCK